MVHDTVNTDYGGGGSGSSSGLRSPGTAVPAVHNTRDRGMACSFANCKAPTLGIPFCILHLSQLNMPKPQQRPPSNATTVAFSHRHTTATVPSQSQSQSQSQASPRLGRTGAYVMRKSASNAGIRPPSFMSTPSSAANHSIPSAWPHTERPLSGPRNEQRFVPLATHHQDRNVNMHTASDTPSSINAFVLSTPGESPPFSRPDGPSNASRLMFSYDGSNDVQSHKETRREAQREALRTPRSRSREPDTTASTTPQQRPSHLDRDGKSDNYMPSAQHRVSHLLSRLRSQGRAAVRESNQPTPSSSVSPFSQPLLAGFSLDTYVYSQQASVSLPPPPGVTISSASDIEAAANAASAAAALERSYAAAMAAVSRASRASRVSRAAAPQSLSPFSSHAQNAPAADYIYAYIDPRIHWTRARSKEWHANKQAEIKARGGRKANLGMAADRTARQKLKLKSKPHAAAVAAPAEPEQPPSESDTVAHRVPSVWQGELPSTVVHNKGWMALVASFANDEEKRLKRVKRQAQVYRQRYGH